MFHAIALTTADDKLHGWDVFESSQWNSLRPVGFIEGTNDNAALIGTLHLNNHTQIHAVNRYVVTAEQFADKRTGPQVRRKGDRLKDGRPVRWESTDAGCIFDGAMGWHNHARVIDLARSLGMVYNDHDEMILDAYREGRESVTLPDGEVLHDLSGYVIDQGEMLDQAVEWLTENIAPTGYGFEFDDGFYLSEIEDEDQDQVEG